MDNKANRPLNSESFILKTSVRTSAYFLVLFVIFLLWLLATTFASNLSWIGWILVVLFSAAVLAAITTFKTVKLYHNGIQIKYIINGKATFYSLTEITNLTYYKTRASFVKINVLKFFVAQKEVVLTTFLYPKIKQMQQELTVLLEE